MLVEGGSYSYIIIFIMKYEWNKISGMYGPLPKEVKKQMRHLLVDEGSTIYGHASTIMELLKMK